MLRHALLSLRQHVARPSTSVRWSEAQCVCRTGRRTLLTGARFNKNSDGSSSSLPPPKRVPTFSFSWVRASVSLAMVGGLVGAYWYMQSKKEEEVEKKRRRALGRAKIGGPWELTSMDGKKMSSKDFHGKWLLIYFGFTHCPDICPDELEKMCSIANTLSQRGNAEPIQPLFFTVDPIRDDAAAVKKYVKDFSDDLIGFTGTVDEVEKVCKTFRVYHSEGPRDEHDDYIVDHTVIMYLVDPEGQFVDYYGQNRTASEVVEAIALQQHKYNHGKNKGWW